MKLPALESAKILGKTVFLRADLNVPLTKFEIRNSKFEIGIEDDTRLTAVLSTIEYLLKNNAKVILASHLGRPKPMNHESRQRRGSPEAARIKNHELSLLPAAHWFSKRFNHNSKFIIHDSKLGDFDGWEVTPSLYLLENLRFYEGEENPTTASGIEFAKKLASLADIYVNDAFAVSHRNNASITGVPKYLPHFAGLLLQEEVRVLSKVLENPKRPLVAIIGGAKIETKLPLVEKMRDFADYVLVGGKIANEIKPFLKEKPNIKETLLIANLNQDGFDITKESVDEFLKIINTAATIVWNGPVGYVEIKEGKYGSTKLAEGIVKSKAYTIVGGGDTLGFLKTLGLLDKFSFVSTAGGAMLEFLSGKELPGLIAILS